MMLVTRTLFALVTLGPLVVDAARGTRRNNLLEDQNRSRRYNLLEEFGPNYQMFLNHGFKSQRITSEQSKQKVDVLGQVLKKHVSKLRSGRGSEADLVFLVDSSASVGADNFYNEIKFIRKLLADFTVSENTTRVVVITYSSVDRVIRQVDHMSVPDPGDHKCRLFDHEIPSITYNSGGTYTLGALLEAQEVFESAREKSKKAVFLITDGYSNGGDPRPEAQKLKNVGVEFFTFGIRNGNVKELYDMASEPKREHSFIVDSFEEFEALARRALHQDLGGGVYLAQKEGACSSLCPSGGSCCDELATCACGAHNGYYSCICPPGYYGRGLKGDCHSCPAGTYKPRQDSGDRRSCLPCPGKHQTSSPGSSSPRQCRCQEGYEMKQDGCHLMDCPALLPPLHGYFVRNECNNVFNAACGVRCNSGYQLSGSSIRLCLPSGSWSGEAARCEVKTCRPMKPANNGYVNCSTGNYQVDTVCTFGCDYGYRLLGSRRRVCLPISLWGGLPAYCKPIKCPRLRKPNYGQMYPPPCSRKKTPFGGQCTFSCQSGFQLQGPSIRKCGGKGSWSGGSLMTRCVDVEAPKISCPNNITVVNKKNSYYAIVSWDEPTATDNSGFLPRVTSVPVVSPPMKFKIGITGIRYFAEDLTGNKNFCSFTVEVADKEPPVVDYCESPPAFVSDTSDVDLEWDLPIFHDNSRRGLSIQQTKGFGKFSYGDTVVNYTATDRAGNQATCSITISLQEHLCKSPGDPINGHRNCSERSSAVYCTLACQEGFAFALQPTSDYYCETSGPGHWLPQNNIFPFPDCSVTSLASVITVPTSLRMNVVQEDSSTVCGNQFFLRQVENHVKEKVLRRLDSLCGTSLYCHIRDLEAICEEVSKDHEVQTNELVGGRRRRRSSRYTPYMYGDYGETEDDVVDVLQDQEGNVFDIADEETKVLKFKDGRQVIEIFFKLIGKYKHAVDEIKQQTHFMDKLSNIKVQVESAAQDGNLDIVLGQDVITLDNLQFSEYSFLCPTGSVVQQNICVNCPVGTFYNIVVETCVPCSAGSYQPDEAQITCLVCPGGTFTKISSGATTRDQCKAQCLPGSYSRDGLEPCTTCPLGTYQDKYAQTNCHNCPAGHATLYRASQQEDDCIGECLPGMTSETGLEDCFPCPVGYFQEQAAQSNCLKCPNKTSTSFPASDSIIDCQGLQNSQEWDLDELEILTVNDCFSLPCLNEATCQPLDIGFLCICPMGYTGSLCEEEKNDCLSSPCENQGTCHPHLAGYTCSCNPGFTGKDCETDIDECEEDLCEHNSTCIDGVASFLCDCADGFQGEFCEQNINDCQNHGCENGGECKDEIGTFSCVCAPGYSGRLCEDDIDDCASSPCGEGSTCIDGINSHSCICGRGRTGLDCSVEVDDCRSSPCYGLASCTDQSQGFACICPPGYSGRLCQTKLLPNFALSFGHLHQPSTETLDYVLLEGFQEPVTQLTICFWMNSADTDNYGTPFSYATATEDNELTVTDYNGFVVSVKGEKVVTDATANDGAWHFICGSWGSPEGAWHLHRDGWLVDQGKGLAKGKTVDAGGLLVIGQEQDSRGGDFSAAESFRGLLTRLDVWGRVLSTQEIGQLLVDCSPYYGDLIAWPDVQKGLRGHLKISEMVFCASCSTLEPPIHGRVKIQGSGSNATGRFSCDDGYYLEGRATARCNLFGEWETSDTLCRLVNCGFPGYLENGLVQGFDYSFGDQIWYSCHEGFQLQGISQSTCEGNGTWSGQKPVCKEIMCSVPESVEHGTLLPSLVDSAVKVGQTVSFQCESGFDMDGLETLECLEDGSWSDLPPTCQPVPCTQPPIVRHGYVAGGPPPHPEQGTVLTYNCDLGYQIGEIDTILCGPGAKWSRPVPRCRPISCDAPSEVTNGKTSFLGVSFGEIVDYKCKKGHYLLGALNSTCTEVGLWEPPPPSCLPVDCGEPRPLPNGEIHVEATTYKNLITFTCNQGFILRGPESRQCTSSGHWSRKHPRCVSVKCGSPHTIPLGVLEREGPYTVGEVAEFKCMPGHSLVLGQALVCDVSGQWTGDSPFCIPDLCPGPDKIENGTILMGTWTKEPMQQPGIQILSQHIQLKRNSSAEFSWRIFGGDEKIESSENVIFYPVGSELWFQCKPGFQTIGPDSNKCTEEVRWENYFPACTEIRCHPLTNIENGRLTVEGFKFQQKVIYECEEGFTISGSTMRTCLESGDWSGSTPTCKPRMCPEPKSIRHGRLGYVSSVEYGSVITYSCSPGYRLVGGAERVCGHNGMWSGQLPVCVNSSQACLVPQLISSGYVAFDGNLEVGSQAWYDCNSQYELVGPKERTCLADGTWSGNKPTCSPKHCQEIKDVKHGQVVGKEFTFESSLQFFCETGYKLEGSSLITCTSNETWSEIPAVCVPILCPSPRGIVNGRVRGSARRYRDSIVYECDPGFTLLGSQVSRCLSDGKWSRSPPQCSKITCPQLPALQHGEVQVEARIPGEKARFRCELGWSLTGDSNITCHKNGQWRGVMPQCVPTMCALDLESINATLITRHQSKYEVNSRLEWSCPEGLNMVGSNQAMCLPIGQWDIEPPICVLAECKKIDGIKNGVIFGLRNTTSGTELRFSCEIGFHQIGDSKVECLVDGTWSGSIPICSKYQCEDPPRVEHSRIKLAPSEASYRAQYSCLPEYNLVGNKYLNCLRNNSWSWEPPKCKLSACPAIPNIPKMRYPRRKIALGETVKFTCQKGYELKGSTFVRCSKRGTWQKEFPFCLPLDCKVKRIIRHGAWNLIPSEVKKIMWASGKHFGKQKKLDQDNHNLFSWISVGDQINVTCDNNFEVLGMKQIRCLPTQGLNAQMPKCKAKHCPNLASISNGFLKVNGTYRGAQVIYNCNPGYELKGMPKRKCRRNKTWSNSAPICEMKFCSPPHDIAHGEVEFDPDNLVYKSQVRFSCHFGYELIGSKTRMCGGFGQWDGEEPECVQVRCTAPAIPLHGDQEILDLAVGGTVKYNCNHGYQMIGLGILTCLGNKTWSHPVPQCAQITCPRPTPLVNGAIQGTSQQYRANIEYQCDRGFILNGQHVRSCLHTGSWSGSPPTCLPSVCEDITVKNGWVRMEGNIPGDKATVGCDNGYKLVGPNVMVCQINLKWIPSSVLCTPVNCKQPPTVENAVLHAQGFNFLDVSNYSCMPGYELRGSKELVCSEDGAWMGDIPSCMPKPCGIPLQVENARVLYESRGGYELGYGSVAHYKCHLGFVAQKKSFLVCEKEGEWRGEVYPCSRVPCGSPPVPKHGIVEVQVTSGTYQATFSCEKGYSLSGNSRLRCGLDSAWEFGVPACVPIQCVSAPSIPHGRLNATSRKFGSLASAVCEMGFKLRNASAQLVCGELGAWVGEEPLCEVVTCPFLAPPNHGRVEWKGVAVGELAIFSCDPGYQMFGYNLTTCGPDGKWSRVVPQCQRVWCPAVDSPQNTFMMGVGRQFGDVIRFSCQPGYRMFGNPQVQCLASGIWDTHPPSCHKVWCESPIVGAGQVVGHNEAKSGQYLLRSVVNQGNHVSQVGQVNQLNRVGQVNQVGQYPHRAVVVPRCQEGHQLQGTLHITCQANGRWSRPEGACHKISCGLPSVDPGVTLVAQSFLYGAQLTYNCPPGQTPKYFSLRCTEDGTWSHPAKCTTNLP